MNINAEEKLSVERKVQKMEDWGRYCEHSEGYWLKLDVVNQLFLRVSCTRKHQLVDGEHFANARAANDPIHQYYIYFKYLIYFPDPPTGGNKEKLPHKIPKVRISANS